MPWCGKDDENQHSGCKRGAWSCRVYPLYHPASIIYNRALVATYQEDLLRLRELLVERGVVK